MPDFSKSEMQAAERQVIRQDIKTLIAMNEFLDGKKKIKGTRMPEKWNASQVELFSQWLKEHKKGPSIDSAKDWWADTTNLSDKSRTMQEISARQDKDPNWFQKIMRVIREQ